MEYRAPTKAEVAVLRKIVRANVSSTSQLQVRYRARKYAEIQRREPFTPAEASVLAKALIRDGWESLFFVEYGSRESKLSYVASGTAQHHQSFMLLKADTPTTSQGDLGQWLKDNGIRGGGVAMALEAVAAGRESEMSPRIQRLITEYGTSKRASSLRSKLIRLAHAKPDLRPALLPLLTRRAGRGRTLDRGTRQRVNQGLNRVGLDGNGRFRKPGLGVSAAWPVLEKYGIEPADVIHADRFRLPSGQFSTYLAFSNPEDPFSPEEISNSMLVIQYTELRDGVYEVLAYLS